MRPARAQAILRTPEIYVAMFSSLLNYPWEMLQAPLYAGLAAAPHWEQVKICSIATAGDAGISLLAFWTAALVGGGRGWLLRPWKREWSIYMAVGLSITIVSERLATGPLAQWRYDTSMPTIPLLEVGLSPVLQWLFLPPLIVWFARNQLLGLAALGRQTARAGPEPRQQ